MKALPLNEIICGDSEKVMTNFPDDSVDLVITSPPYDDIFDYREFNWNFNGIAKQLQRVLKPGGVIVWVVNDETVDGGKTGSSFEQALAFKKLGLRIHDTMIWNKCGFSAVGSTSVRYGPVFDYMFVISKGQPSTFRPLKDRPNKLHKVGKPTRSGSVRLKDGKLKKQTHQTKLTKRNGIRFNIWNIPAVHGHPDHPATFPVSLVRDHIYSWGHEGCVVLDPFSGSGTTSYAAKNCGCKYIGIDISSEYCSYAKDRLSKGHQLNIFGGSSSLIDWDDQHDETEFEFIGDQQMDLFGDELVDWDETHQEIIDYDRG